MFSYSSRSTVTVLPTSSLTLPADSRTFCPEQQMAAKHVFSHQNLQWKHTNIKTQSQTYAQSFTSKAIHLCIITVDDVDCINFHSDTKMKSLIFSQKIKQNLYKTTKHAPLQDGLEIM